MRHITRSVHQNITRQGSQTVTKPSILGPISVIELAGPILIIGAHRAAHYNNYSLGVLGCGILSALWLVMPVTFLLYITFKVTRIKLIIFMNSGCTLGIMGVTSSVAVVRMKGP